MHLSFCILNPHDTRNLSEYLNHLSEDSRKRFAPHSFNEQEIRDYYQRELGITGYLAVDPATTYIEAYFVVRRGIPEHDRQRFESYGLVLSETGDCLLAPSVSDAWQSRGIGTLMLEKVLADLESNGIKRVFLWGGVQADNQQAIRFYLKNQFKIIGKFEHNGENYDMIRG